MKNYVLKEKLNRKLCIHCKHVESRYETYYCGLFRDNIADAPIYQCSQVRNQIDFCNGEKWAKKDDIIGCDTQQEINEKAEEEGINSYLNMATKLVATNSPPLFACGYLEKAILRVKNNIEKNKK